MISNTSSLTSLLPLHQIFDFATCGNSKLDPVFTDIQEYVTSRCICLSPILNNYHCAIEIPPASALRPSKYQTVAKRTVTASAKIAITEELSRHNWRDIYDELSVDKKVEIFQNRVSQIFDKHCPLRSMRKPEGKPLLTSTLLQ